MVVASSSVHVLLKRGVACGWVWFGGGGVAVTSNSAYVLLKGVLLGEGCGLEEGCGCCL